MLASALCCLVRKSFSGHVHNWVWCKPVQVSVCPCGTELGASVLLDVTELQAVLQWHHIPAQGKATFTRIT